MDKKNTTIGAILLIAAFAVMFLAPKSPAPTRPENAQVATAATTSPEAAPATATAASPSGTFAAINKDSTEAKVTTLSNDYIEARLTNFGGAVREVAFRKYADIQGSPEPYVFNRLHEDPILAFADVSGLGRNVAYELVSSNDREAVYRTVLDGKIEVTRRYTLTSPDDKDGDPYRLRHETTFRNLSNEKVALPRTPALGLGTATLVNSADYGQSLNVTSFDGEDVTFTDRSDLEGGGFFSSLFGGSKLPKPVLDVSGNVVWASIKNQFFASIYTPDQPATGIVVRRIELPQFKDDNRPNIGLTGAARVGLPEALEANGTAKTGGLLYVGPKEYKRISKFQHGEDAVMQYSRGLNKIFLSGYVAPLENTLLNLAHKMIPNWGVAVILMTLMLKIVSLPFTIAASRSAKRMAKLQPEMKALREKYKDNPQKQQMATMELFKQHKVNPVGGCIPVLITMPLFFGFYAMLMSAAELRFQPFLWAPDLSAPDTVGHIFGFPINVMPLLMGATMIFQMRLTPQPSVDKAQAMMMKFMPVVIIAFCYNFSCALALYSTINGLFSIGQQLVINRMSDDGDPAGKPVPTKTAPGGKHVKNVKNVTPKKKG